jgi:hypothetical protein
MLVAAHQPIFMPWLGYLDKMHQADLFIIMDDVQFARRDYQNRTRIRLGDMAHWLTVPVQQHSQQEIINEKLIDYPAIQSDSGWMRGIGKTLDQAYRRAPFFAEYGPVLQEILDFRWPRLLDLNLALLAVLRDAYGIRTPLVFSSDLNVGGSKSSLILNLCKAVGADSYLAGMGGSRYYLDRPVFAERGVEIVWQEFQHPVYPQCGKADFLPGLSAIDLLFNQGPESRVWLWPQDKFPGSPAAKLVLSQASG